MHMKRLSRSQAVEPIRLAAILSLPVALSAAICALHMVSREAADVMAAWTLASFPIGVLVGQCVLRDK